MARRTRWWLGPAVAAAVLAAGCAAGGEAGGGASGDGAADTTRSTTTTAVPAPPAPTVEDEVLAAYQGYWDTWLAANDPPDPDHPDLERYATGAALERDRETITGHRSVGQRLRLPEDSISEHRASVVSIEGNIARVADCSIDDGLVVANGSDLVLDDSVVTWSYEATLVQDSGWRVTELRVLGRSDGVSGCAY